MAKHGEFSGNPITEWLVDPRGDDRDMKLMEDFSFTDPKGKRWEAPKDSIINGASIPRALWAAVGSPFTDDYRRASVVHDVACQRPGIVRKAADVMFYHACRAGGCSAFQSRILYAGVRLGAWASTKNTAAAVTGKPLLMRSVMGAQAWELDLQGKLAEIAREMGNLREEASIAELDAVIRKHVKVPSNSIAKRRKAGKNNAQPRGGHPMTSLGRRQVQKRGIVKRKKSV
jgi:hypothetical protein